MSKKILIANRGEIVIRIARTCRKLDIIPCGIYSDADKNSLHIRRCKQTMNIGGTMPSESYLRIDKIIDAAKKLDCDLIHPGYGFLSENRTFTEICKKEGLIFVGPSHKVMSISCDKVMARRIASKVAPVVDGDEVSNESNALNMVENIGFPVILKAVEGGGGRGLRIVRSCQQLKDAVIFSKNESMISFGSGRVYVEKYVENPRHIEVQILADNSNIIHLGERECTIQRRHQKLIEETPSPALTLEMRKRIIETAIAIMKEIGYENAGTVEFLFKDGKFYFMEVNARIQVEHPITEAVTGVDIVEQQLNIALGNGLPVKQADIKSKGHAIECRINAEHPISFIPFAGTVKKFTPPEEDGVRIDTALYTGYTIPTFYDSLIAKLICVGNDRHESIQKMKRSLSSFRISGIPSTIPFHISALSDRRFVEGSYDTSFIDEMNPFSSKEGEIAAAILSSLPKKMEFIESREKEEQDLWMKSRFDWIDMLDVSHTPHKWVK
ncbi:MAG: biotin carboxylase N-terminal domain-containing protein [Candidatus Nitrosopolaris sp.]